MGEEATLVTCLRVLHCAEIFDSFKRRGKLWKTLPTDLTVKKVTFERKITQNCTALKLSIKKAFKNDILKRNKKITPQYRLNLYIANKKLSFTFNSNISRHEVQYSN